MAGRAPRLVVASNEARASSTAKAMSRTPSPWRWTCSAISPSAQGAGQDERDVVPAHDVAGPVADAGLEARESDRGEAPQGPEVGRRLAGVAHPELDVVDAVEGQEVARLGIRVLVDVGAGLVRGTLAVRGGRADGRLRPRRADGLGHRESLRMQRAG